MSLLRLYGDSILRIRVKEGQKIGATGRREAIGNQEQSRIAAMFDRSNAVI